jgi:threonine/homoserine/homoserine lactone efflux protein
MGCLPLAVGLFFAFLTLDQPNPKLVAGYIAIISVTAILGLFFFVIWFRTRRRAKDLLERIREMSPFVELQGVEETTTPDAPPSPPNASENQP